jgi:hypothetical protein
MNVRKYLFLFFITFIKLNHAEEFQTYADAYLDLVDVHFKTMYAPYAVKQQKVRNNWNNELKSIKNDLKTHECSRPCEFTQRLQGLLGTLQDPDLTILLDRTEKHQLPIRLGFLDGRLFVVNAANNTRILPRQYLRLINSIPIEDFSDSHNHKRIFNNSDSTYMKHIAAKKLTSRDSSEADLFPKKDVWFIETDTDNGQEPWIKVCDEYGTVGQQFIFRTSQDSSKQQTPITLLNDDKTDNYQTKDESTSLEMFFKSDLDKFESIFTNDINPSPEIANVEDLTATICGTNITAGIWEHDFLGNIGYINLSKLPQKSDFETITIVQQHLNKVISSISTNTTCMIADFEYSSHMSPCYIPVILSEFSTKQYHAFSSNSVLTPAHILKANTGMMINATMDTNSKELVNYLNKWWSNGNTMSKYIKYHVTEPKRTNNTPLIVLQNGSTANAAEVIVNALQDTRQAVTLGDNTAGSAGEYDILAFNNPLGIQHIKYKSGLFLKPNGELFEDNPVKPNRYLNKIKEHMTVENRLSMDFFQELQIILEAQ